MIAFVRLIGRSYIALMQLMALSVGAAIAQELPPIKYTRTDHSTTDWYLETLKPTPNYYKVRKLYDEFFSTHGLEKSPQRNIVLRWLQVYRNYLNANGEVVIDAVPPAETQALMQRNTANARQAAGVSPYPAWNDQVGTWRMIGPYHGKDKSCYNQPYMSGGFNDRVYINPYNTQNLYAGQSYGGLWVSQDQGATWKLTDAEFPNGKNTYANRDVYYGDIKASKANPNLVFAATEAGLLKSTNAGNSWSLVSGLNYIERPTERAYFVAPSNHDTNLLLASYGRRIYRSTDGGATWTVVFSNTAGGTNYSQGQHTTNGVGDRKYNFAGLSFHPTNNNVVYLAAREASTNRITVQVSTDFGQTWSVLIPGSRVVNGVTQTTTNGPVKMEISPAAADKIYLFNLFQDLNSGTTIGATKGIVKYNTNGDLLQAIPYPVTGHLLDDCTVSQTDSTVLYLGGYASGEVHKSTNGGLTFFTNNPGYTSCVNYVHADVRCLSSVGDLLLIASDGGNHISKDGMATIQPTGEWISAIDLWGFSAAFKGDVVASGDDHGPTEVRWFDGDQGWEHDGGADSKDLTINPVQPRWIYAMDIYRKYRMVTKEAAFDKSYPIDNNSISSLKYHAVHPNIYGKSYPFKDNKLLVSNDNMASLAGTLYTFPENITRMKQPLRNPSVFFVLTNNKDVYKSTDGAATFTKLTPSTTITGGRTNITDIEVSQDGSVVWLSYGQVQTTCKVVKSTDGGTTWTNYSIGLPSPAASNITMQRGTNGGVYVSTNGGGVWYRDNSMSAWAMLGTGLPMLGYVTSAYVVPDKKAYRMGTSRGAFEHELAFLTTSDALIAVDKNTAGTCRDTLFFRDYSAYEGTTGIRFAWTFEGGTPATSTAENPKVVYANPGTYDVSLTVTDANGVSSTHTLTDFISVTAAYCGPDTLRGKAMQITAQNSYVQAPAPNVATTNTYTMMAWVKLNGAQADYAGMLSLSTTTGLVHLNLRDVNPDSTQLGYHHPNGQWWYNSGLYLKPNVWTHVALVVQPNAISVLKDGVRATHTGRNVVPASFVGNVTIGTMAGGAEWYRTFIGDIDEVAIYKRALTDDEIRRMMHLTKNNPQYPVQADPDLINYYQFNESGTLIFDRVSTRDASFVGGAVSRVESTGPFSGGLSETMASVASAGPKSFTGIGLTLNQPASGTYAAGAVTAYRLLEKPYMPPSASVAGNYWIVRNWGTSKTFSSLVSLTVNGMPVAPSDLDTPGSQRLYARPQNSHLANWFLSDVPASAVTGSPTGSVQFSGSGLTTFGQLVLTRTDAPALIATTPTNAATGVSPTTSLTLVFDQSVTKGTGNLLLVRTSDNTTVETIAVSSSQVSGTATTWVITPAQPLLVNTGYALRADVGTFSNSSGGQFTGLLTNAPFSFTTGSGGTGMFSTKNGLWSDPATWLEGRVPTATDTVTITHTVTVSANYTGNALRLIINPPGKVIYISNGKLRLGE
ncbi:LamG-like jellyroll fold domain-containing protein [Rudanella lutea]|uniref:LamG-like jellyroll fold domain-containing protein n=1 Tax=Rudanella lutea TaxID=451374 RepID=UPI0003724389|nr:LamG-like jellyroll fold domain-containing protein [Rudanella lutea]